MKTEQVRVENRSYLFMYERAHSNNHVATCSPYTKKVQVLRDAQFVEKRGVAPESFEEDSLVPYFTEGVQILKRALGRFENLSESFTLQDAKQLTFMMEALIHSRTLLEETLP